MRHTDRAEGVHIDHVSISNGYTALQNEVWEAAHSRKDFALVSEENPVIGETACAALATSMSRSGQAFAVFRSKSSHV